MMNDRFSAQLRQHLLETADERPADGRLEAIDERVAVTAQRPRLVARLGWFPGRVDPFASGAVRYALIAAALIVAIVAAALAAGVGSPSASGAIGGIVHYQIDGGPATTEIDAVADSASLSGTAVTTFRAGTHTVRLGCAAHVRRYMGPRRHDREEHGPWRVCRRSGRRSPSRTARPSRSRSGSPPAPPKPVAPATPSWRRSSQPSSSLGSSIRWSPGCWCPRLIPSPERERGVNA